MWFCDLGYDTNGRLTLSKRAGDTAQTTIVYNSDGSRIETNPLGKQIKYHVGSHATGPKVTRIEGLASANTPASDTYNATTSTVTPTRSPTRSGTSPRSPTTRRASR